MTMMKNNKLSGRLNPQQLQAVEHYGGPLLIVAGAGTGKTRVITHRIAHLISERGVSPYNILSLTFTNKAADEMRERTMSLIGERAAGTMTCTFHSFCNYVLRRDIESLKGYRRGFSIYDEDDARSCVKQILKQMELGTSSQFSPARICGIFSKAKNFGARPDDYVSPSDRLSDYISEIYERYTETLLHNNALDFEDLLLKTVELLRTDRDALVKYRTRFSHILVDEYQDTNAPQYELLQYLAAPDGDITVVGDLDQSIYGWRGADSGNMLSFETDFKGARVIALEQNYRSVQIVLDAANALISHNHSIFEKKLWSDLGEGEPIALFTPWDEREEAMTIASEIDYLLGEGYTLKDMAVMFRTRAQSRVFEETFMRMNIPYRLIGATAFYHRMEIKDVVSYLRTLENPSDFNAFERIANTPRRGIGDKTLEAIRALTSPDRTVLNLVDESGKAVDGLPKKAAPLINILNKCRAAREELGIGELIKKLLYDTGYMEYLDTLEIQEGTASRRENVEELVNMAVEFAHDVHNPTLDAFLSRIALMSDADKGEETEDRANLLTMHVAKGQEYPVVFISGVEEGLLPHTTSLEEADGVNEERRLCYVGVTRARERLYLSCCRSRMRFGQVANNPQSRFIREIGLERIKPRDGASFVADDESFFTEEERRGMYSSSEIVDDDCEYGDDDSGTSLSPFKKGTYVIHKHFGKGCVVDISGDEIGISFPGLGVKHFDLSYAPIKKSVNCGII